MAHTDIGYITAPVDMKADVQWVLMGGDTSGEINQEDLCKNSHVNLWASNKPTDGTVTGVTPKKVSLTDLPNFCAGHANGWVRKTPKAPFDLTSFDGYRHRGAPCTGFYVSGTPSNFNDYFTAEFTLNNGTNGVLDLTTLVGKTCYFGVYCVGESNSETHRSQSTTTIADNGNSVRVFTDSWTVQWYKVYPYLADADGNYYSVPNLYYDRVYVKQSSAPTPQIPIESVIIYDDYNGSLNGQTISLPLTLGTYQLRQKNVPNNATVTGTSWSTRSGRATIDNTGKLTLVSKGTDIIDLHVNGAHSSYAEATVNLTIY